MTAVVTVLTSTRPQRLAKLWRREGVTYKKEAAGQMLEGQAEQYPAGSPIVLAGLIDSLECNQALSFGVADMSPVRVVTRAALADYPGAIARSREFFNWPAGSGWMVFDYDPPAGRRALSIEQVRQALVAVCPGLEQAPMTGYYSGSSWIQDTAAVRWATENRGVHLLVLVSNAAEISKAGERLAERLWLGGQGYYSTSKSGALLERTLVDTAVWQPERLIFSAKPVCHDGLAAQRPAAQVWHDDGKPLDLSSALPELSAAERREVSVAKAEAKNSPALQQEIIAAREAWLDERMESLPVSVSDAERTYYRYDLERAVRDQVLAGEFELTSSDGRKVQVADLLAEPEQWDRVEFADPLEADRADGDMRIAFARTVGVLEPFVWSNAHGGVKFHLGVRREELVLLAGSEGVAAERIARHLAEIGAVYRRGASLVRVRSCQQYAVEQPSLKGLVESSFRLVKHNATSGKPRVSSCPDDLARRVLAVLPQYCKPLRALVGYPVISPDGRVLNRPGYDAATGLYYAPPSGEGRAVIEIHGDEALCAAVRRVWSPFRGFCFAADADRSMYLALLFTLMMRPALETSPGFLIRAHAPGTGKTLLSKALLAVAHAAPLMLTADTRCPDEFGKRIGQAVRSGAPVVVFDNLSGIIQDDQLNAALTSDRVLIRRLGSNDAESPTETRSLWLMNGNNVSPSSDMNRRLLPVTLDAKMEHPELRRFDSNPVAEISARVESYQDDLLAIMVTFHAAGAPQIETSCGLGSYEDWERCVRQLILWLGQKGALPFEAVDVADVVKANGVEDPEKVAYRAFLEALHALHDGRAFTLRHMESANDGVFAGGSHEQMELGRTVREAAAELAPAGQGQAYNARVLGSLLRSKVGQVVGGLRLEKGTKGMTGMRYRIVKC